MAEKVGFILPTSNDEEDAKQVVNFIWYELLEYPEIMQT
jgi:hypothetical protein